MPMYKKSLIALVLIIGVVSAIMFLTHEDELPSPEQETAALTEDRPAAAGTAAATGEIAVYVSGEVNKPGVVLLSSNSRISDAILACGDFTPGADRQKVNLAGKVNDGQQINVPAKSGNSAQASATASPQNRDGDVVNINTASSEELQKLPGIGPAMAKRIIDYREANGNFSDLADLQKVKGIGKAKYSKIQDKIAL